MKIKFKKLDELAQIPTKAHEADAGFDLTATECARIGELLCVRTGLAVSIPHGYVGLLFPRSSIYKTGNSFANSVGVVDSGYTGEIYVNLYQHSMGRMEYKVGDRVCQLIIIPIPKIEFEEVEELDETERGDGGFGSTGR